MEMSLFKKEGKTWTRFKVRKKDKDNWIVYLYAKFGIDIKIRSKKTADICILRKKGIG